MSNLSHDDLRRKLDRIADAVMDGDTGLISAFISECRESNVPSVTLYMPASYEGWYRMCTAFVFSKRTDVRQNVWYFSPRRGVLVCDREDGDGTPLKQWDREARIFTDPSLDDGGTNMSPFAREKLDPVEA